MRTAYGTVKAMRYIGAMMIALAVMLTGCTESGDDTAGESRDSVAGDSMAADTGTTATSETRDSIDGAWETFWTNFRTAVRDRDSAEIVRLMAPGFDYGNDVDPSMEVVFRELGQADSENWRVLEKTLDQGTQPYDHPVSDRPARVAIDSVPCSTPPCRFQSWAIFQQEVDGTWRWSALLFPGD